MIRATSNHHPMRTGLPVMWKLLQQATHNKIWIPLNIQLVTNTLRPASCTAALSPTLNAVIATAYDRSFVAHDYGSYSLVH